MEFKINNGILEEVKAHFKTEVVIPDGVISIGEGAFIGCRSLKRVTIPNSVTSIGNEAFSNCTSLTRINIPNSVTSIGHAAFLACTSLPGVTIPDSVTSIGDSAFAGCTSLANISIDANNNHYTDIDGVLFDKSRTTLMIYPRGKVVDYTVLFDQSGATLVGKGAKSYTIPDSVTNITGGAFAGCTSLETVNIPNSVTSIGGYAFSGCTSLASITVPDSVTTIGDGAFSDTSLTSVTIPDSVIVLGKNGYEKTMKGVFENCSVLKSVSLSKSIAYLAGCLFKSCVHLESVSMPDHLSAIYAYAFEDCASLTGVNIPDGITSIGEKAFSRCTLLTGITVPDGVTDIGVEAFWGCSLMVSVNIPDSVTSIGKDAFRGCGKLTIYAGVETVKRFFPNPKLLAAFEYLTHPDGYSEGSCAEHIQYCKASAKKILALIIGSDNAAAMKGYAEMVGIRNYNSLCEAVSENGAEKIKTFLAAYKETAPIKEIKTRNKPEAGSIADIKSLWVVKNIDDKTCMINRYKGDEKEIVIPDAVGDRKVVSLGIVNQNLNTNSGFKGCEKIVVPEGILQIEERAFYGCETLNEITLPQSLKKIGCGAFSMCKKLGSIIIPDSVTRIGKRAFELCTELKSVTLSSRMRSIDDNTFGHCSKLESIVMPANVKSIGGYAFYGCSSLENANIPDGVISIGDSAFHDCGSLTSITIPDGVTSIGKCAFTNCTKLFIHASDGSTAGAYAKKHNKKMKTQKRDTATERQIETHQRFEEPAEQTILITPDDSIDKIGLSVRSSNALHRAGVHTVGEMLALDRERLMNMKNLGVKSLGEIEALQEEIHGEGRFKLADANSARKQAEEAPVFFDRQGTPFRDIPLSELGLSYRANRLLRESGFDFASKLIGVTEERLLAIPNMGRGSVDEINAKLASLAFEEVKRIEENTLAQKNYVVFVSSYIDRGCFLPTDRGELFQAFLPSFETALKSGEPVSLDIKALFEQPVLQACAKRKIIAVLQERLFGVKQRQLLSIFTDHFPVEDAITAILHELSREGKIRIGRTIELVRPTLWEYVGSISEDKQREMLTLRLRGKTLKEIGEICGCTRERARQVIRKCMQEKRVTIEEDRYREIYDTYAFSKDDFSLAFGTDESVYFYLTLVCDKKGTAPIERFLEDDDDYYPAGFQEGVERVLNKAVDDQYFTIGGVRVFKQRADLADYVVRTYFQDEAVFDDFAETYYTVLQNLNMENDSRFVINERTYQKRFADGDNVLSKPGRKFRYYDMTGRDFTALLEGLHLEQYTDVEYGALKFFRAYPDLMREYDLHDEYELHNLLRKLYKETGSINFSRTPIMEFGSIDRGDQVLDLLIRLAPISVADFCQAYEDEYGVLARTVAGNFISCIDAYRDNELYDISAETLPPEQMRKMRELLRGDYYDIQHIRHLYRHEFPDADPNMINAYTLKSMGFKVYSSYVIRDSFANAAEYFRHILTKEDVIDARDFPTTLTSQVSYGSELYSLKSRYEIIEFEPLRYINKRRLESAGVTAQDMKDYCDKVSEFAKTYFTIHSLRRRGFIHPLDDLGFDDWFYASILTEDKERYRYLRAGGTKVFCLSVKQMTAEDLFAYIVGQRGSMDIYEFSELLQGEYGINFDRYKIAEIIDRSPMYYDRIMERIYVDYDTYFEEV